LCPADPSVKEKPQVFLYASWGNLIIKMHHSTTRQTTQKISTNLDHHWSKKCLFFACKRIGFVHQELRDFVKMTLTRVESESPKIVTRVESLTRVALSLVLVWHICLV